MSNKFSTQTTLIAAIDITDESGDNEIFVPAGTEMQIVSIESDDCAIVDVNGKNFVVSLEECK